MEVIIMAQRPYFYVSDLYVSRRIAEFEWFAGFAVSQQQKSIASFHSELRSMGFNPLEVSTKSTDALGRKLSAFNLELDGHKIECIYQSSKVFRNGGPYTDLLEKSPKDAKRDERLRTSGELTKYSYRGEDWSLIPKTLFYDFIYYEAVRQSLTQEELEQLMEYDAFTDIAFNPNKSLNTQARSVAVVAFVYSRFGSLPAFGRDEFLEIHRKIVIA